MAILIVDDVEENRLVMRRLLSRAGYAAVQEAGSAEEALVWLNQPATEQRFDLILMDISMPGMDGVEACRRASALESLRDTPILMVTACDETGHVKSAFDAGAFDYITRPINRTVFLARVQHALRLKAEIDQRKRREAELVARERELLETKSQLEEANTALARLAGTDPLTGIANRRAFSGSLERVWEDARRSGDCLAVILADIDFFKSFNDTYGHPAGDECLKRVASALRGALRENDGLLARYGGEEMVVLLSRMTELHAVGVAERLCDAVRQADIPHGASLVSSRVTVSAGVATSAPAAGGTPEELVGAADIALYRAKQAGRDRVCAYTAG